MSWLDEPAFRAERAEIARWAVSISLGRRDESAPAAELQIPHSGGLRVAELPGVTIAAAGAPPEVCLRDLHRILASARPDLRGTCSLERLRAPADADEERFDGRGAHAWIALLPSERMAVAYRDPLGRIPLFWHRNQDRLLISADTERLVELGVPGRPNPGTLIGQLSSLWGPADETYLSDVLRVPPGRALVATAEGERLIRHWDPIGGIDPGSQKLDQERFTSLFTEAVAREAGRSRVGVYLSGGLDSVSVAAIARRHADEAGLEPPHALSADFSGSDFDESRIQAGVASGLGLGQTLRPHGELSGGDPLLAALELASTMPAPPQNFFLPGFITLGREGADLGCHAILTGSGGDEWFGVTPALAADLIARGDLRGLLRLYTTVRRSNPVRISQAARAVFWTFGVRGLLGTILSSARSRTLRGMGQLAASRHRRAIPEWIAPGVAGAAELDRKFAALRAQRPAAPGAHYATEVRNGFDHPVATTEAEEHVEQGRRAGIPLRHPFLDPELVRLLCAVRPDDLNVGGRTKAPLRALVARELPGLGFETQKKPVAAGYVSNVVSRSGPRAYERLGGARALASLGVVDPGGVEDLVNAVRAESDRLAPYRLWDVLSLEAWVRPRL